MVVVDGRGERTKRIILFCNLEACAACIKVEPWFLQIRFQSIIAAQM